MQNIAPRYKPIGLADAVCAIEEMCNHAAAYAYGNVAAPHYLLELDAGNGQTRFVRYVTEMMKSYRIRRFGGLDSYLEFTTDGSMEQLQKMFSVIGHGVFTNHYEGIVAVDITALARVVREKQMRCFISEITKAAKYATIIFFVSPRDARNRSDVDSLVKQITDAFGNKLRILPVQPYTNTELAEMVACNIDDRGIVIKDDGRFLDTLEQIIAAHPVKLARETEDLADEIIKHADFSKFVASVDTKGLYAAFPQDFEAERGNSNAK